MGRKRKRPVCHSSISGLPTLDLEVPHIGDMVPERPHHQCPPKLFPAFQQERTYCSMCSVEVDLKPQIVIDQDTTSPSDPSHISEMCSGQISLETLCTLGHGYEKSTTKDNCVNRKSSCSLCPECFMIVEEVRELKQHIELLKSDMSCRVVTLKVRVEESLRVARHKKGRPRQDLGDLRQIQKVLIRAFSPELLPNPVTGGHSNTFCGNGVLENIAERTHEKQIKLESGNSEEPTSFDFNGHRILTIPVIKSEFRLKNNGGIAVRNKNSEAIEASPFRQKRKYIKKEPHMEGKENPIVKFEKMECDDEDWSPQKRQKRKYTRRKPFKRELHQPDITYNIAAHAHDWEQADNGADDFIIPIIQSVKTEDGSPAKGCSAMINAGDGKWLTDNVEPAEKGIILRSTLYLHYIDYCAKNKKQPQNQATFGKLVKNIFQGFVKCRRLGRRGCSMYCHSGIQIKPNSPLNDITEEYDIGEDTPNKPEGEIGRSGTGKRGVLKELGIRVPQRVQQNRVLFSSVPIYGAASISFIQDMPFATSVRNDDTTVQSPTDILRNLMS